MKAIICRMLCALLGHRWERFEFLGVEHCDRCESTRRISRRADT